MSADVLRRAASLMRERAEAATASPWVAGERCVWTTGVPDEDDDTVISDGPHGNGGIVEPNDAPHIASWHPAVALAVADWLDTVAERLIDSANTGAVLGGTDYEAALTVARTYLGDSA